jgi:hypothetical protein
VRVVVAAGGAVVVAVVGEGPVAVIIVAVAAVGAEAASVCFLGEGLSEQRLGFGLGVRSSRDHLELRFNIDILDCHTFTFVKPQN